VMRNMSRRRRDNAPPEANRSRKSSGKALGHNRRPDS
jgi:hypothetical protein